MIIRFQLKIIQFCKAELKISKIKIFKLNLNKFLLTYFQLFTFYT